jgi:Pyruvate/2-oxoacid:ferredoxin oxidoreductase delta subunit
VLHGYVYYRWTDRYIAAVRYFLSHPRFGTLRTIGGRWLERTHHAKVVPAEDARRIITVDKPIDWRGLERVVPFRVARDIVLDAPVRITLAPCACRTVAQRAGDYDGSCGPIDACLYVGDPVASFVAEKQKGARSITAEEALEVLDRAATNANVHTLWFKDAANGRMYAICNCCTCCCIGMKARSEGFSPLAGSGYLAHVDTLSCTACGRCVHVCPFDAIALGDANEPASVAGVAEAATIDSARCLGCGVCVRECPEDAIELAAAEDGVDPLPWADAADALV